MFKSDSTKLFLCAGISLSALIFAAFELIPKLNAALVLPFAALVLVLVHIGHARKLAMTAALIPTILLGFFIAIYRPVGFEYPLIWHTDGMYPGGKAFDLTTNLSKAIGGYLLIICFARRLVFPPGATCAEQLRKNILIVALCIASILFVANTFFGVAWQPKYSDGIFYFIFVNLLFTTLSEEAFFRLLIHDHVASYFKNQQTGAATGITITTILFTFSHSSAYGPAFLLYAFVGFIYAFVYSKTNSLTACIAVHFGVNIFHFIFLEYPM